MIRYIFYLCCFLLFSCHFVFSQQLETVDFLQADAEIHPDWETKTISGTVHYKFKIFQNTDSIFLDAHHMKINNFKGVNNLKATDDKIWLFDSFKQNQTYSVSFSYEAQPKQTFYFMVDKNEMWTQGQGKYTSYWLPSLDDTNDKMIFNLSINVPKNKTAIANGKQMNVISKEKFKTWEFQMQNLMSSYLVAVAIGDFDKKTLYSKSGIPLELYYKPKDSDKIDFTYKYSKEIFDFLEDEIGFPYPWEVYKQVPLRDFLYAGMENTSATFFSEAFLTDSIGFNDRNYVNVNAHELAHQWFGNTVTAKSDEHHWLQEGFATYYALLAEKEIFGEDYFYWQLLQYAEQLQEMSNEGKGESLMNPKASSLTFYQKGAWAIHILREKIGSEIFKKGVRNYLDKYQFQNVTTDQFLDEIKALSDADLSEFEKNWLRQSAFQIEEVYNSLLKSEFIKSYFEISSLRSLDLKDKKEKLQTALHSGNDFIGQEAVYQLTSEPASETYSLYKTALQSENLYIRQAVAFSLETIPKQLLPDYEKLLDDDSYATQEIVFTQIWNYFPEKRAAILEKMKDRIGFQNKNLRQLWLVLSWLTEQENETLRNSYFEELRKYTASEYSFEIREKAFEYFYELELWDRESLKNLIQACAHPAWRFSKSSKTILKSVLLKGDYEPELRNLKNELSSEEQELLNSLYEK